MEECKKIPREWRPWVTRHLPCQHFSAEFLMWYSRKILDTNPFDRISLWISKKKYGRCFKLAFKRKIVQLNLENIIKLSLTNSYKEPKNHWHQSFWQDIYLNFKEKTWPMLQIGIQKKNSAVKFEKNCQIVTIELLQTNQNSLTTIILTRYLFEFQRRNMADNSKEK